MSLLQYQQERNYLQCLHPNKKQNQTLPQQNGQFNHGPWLFIKSLQCKVGPETRPKTKEHQESSQLRVRYAQLCQQDLLSREMSFQVQTEMESEINFSKVLQFPSVQKYKKTDL